jgi:hypothetical protein
MTVAVALLGSAASLGLGGCAATLRSEQLDPCKASVCVAPPGVVYALPKGQFLLQASRREIVPTDLAAATTALSAAADTVKKDWAAIATAKAKLVSDTDGDKDGKGKGSPLALATDQAAIDSLVQGMVADQMVLDQATANFTKAQKALGLGIETFTLAQLPVGPDPGARYVAHLSHSALRDDNIKVDLGTGLLTAATTSSTDQSVNALVSLAETAITLASFFGAGIPLAPPSAANAAPAGPNDVTPPAFSPECTYELAEIFDPLNPADVDRVNNMLRAHNATIELTTRFSRDVAVTDSGSDGTVTLGPGETPTPTDLLARTAAVGRASDTSSDGTSGLVYRTATSVIVTVDPVSDPKVWAHNGAMIGQRIPCQLQAKPPAVSLLAVVPDSRTRYVVDADAGAFTTSTHSYTFASGMLAEHSVNRPSEVMAPVRAVSQLAQDIVAIPGAIIKFRVDYTNQSDTLVKARQALTTDRIAVSTAVLGAQKNVDDARAALIKAQFGDAQAWVDAQTSLVKAQTALVDAQKAAAADQGPGPASR